MFYTFVIPTQNLEHAFNSGNYQPLNKYFTFNDILQSVLRSESDEMLMNLFEKGIVETIEKQHILDLSLQSFIDNFCECVSHVIGTEYYTYEFIKLVFGGFIILVSYDPNISFKLNNDKLLLSIW